MFCDDQIFRFGAWGVTEQALIWSMAHLEQNGMGNSDIGAEFSSVHVLLEDFQWKTWNYNIEYEQ